MSLVKNTIYNETKHITTVQIYLQKTVQFNIWMKISNLCGGYCTGNRICEKCDCKHSSISRLHGVCVVFGLIKLRPCFVKANSAEVLNVSETQRCFKSLLGGFKRCFFDPILNVIKMVVFRFLQRPIHFNEIFRAINEFVV